MPHPVRARRLCVGPPAQHLGLLLRLSVRTLEEWLEGERDRAHFASLDLKILIRLPSARIVSLHFFFFQLPEVGRTRLLPERSHSNLRGYSHFIRRSELRLCHVSRSGNSSEGQ